MMVYQHWIIVNAVELTLLHHHMPEGSSLSTPPPPPSKIIYMFVYIKYLLYSKNVIYVCMSWSCRPHCQLHILHKHSPWPWGWPMSKSILINLIDFLLIYLSVIDFPWSRLYDIFPKLLKAILSEGSYFVLFESSGLLLFAHLPYPMPWTWHNYASIDLCVSLTIHCLQFCLQNLKDIKCLFPDKMEKINSLKFDEIPTAVTVSNGKENIII